MSVLGGSMINQVVSSVRVSGSALATASAICLGLACLGCAAKPIAGRSAAASQPVSTPAAVPPSTAPSASPAASPAASPTFGTFNSWTAAQLAAGFALLQPASTSGLPLNGGIQVGSCAGDSAYADVVATYESGSNQLTIDQTDEPPPQVVCSNIGAATTLGTYNVNGAQAQLLGACGTSHGMTPCSPPIQWLFLVWTIGSDRHYQVTAHNESQAHVLVFAQSLSAVS